MNGIFEGPGDEPRTASSFRGFVDEHVEFLRREAARRLERLVREGLLPRRRRSVEGVVDETLLLAWERFGGRPATSPVEDWLRDLVAEVLETAVEHARETTPEIPPGVALAASDNGGVHALTDEDDPVIWEDLLPDSRHSEPLHGTTSDEEREAVLAFLVPLPAADRDAFALHVFDGWEPGDIAAFQKRDAAAVLQGIEAARRKLGAAG